MYFYIEKNFKFYYWKISIFDLGSLALLQALMKNKTREIKLSNLNISDNCQLSTLNVEWPNYENDIQYGYNSLMERCKSCWNSHTSLIKDYIKQKSCPAQ